jgi:hypothetical protein
MSSQQPTAKKPVRARGVIVDRENGRFLAVVNESVVPGSPTVMLPGGDSEGSDLLALSRDLGSSLGLKVELGPENTRFLMNRTYVSGSGPLQESVCANFYAISSDGSVPRNMLPESVSSVRWMTLDELSHHLNEDGWRIQLGGIEAIEAALGQKMQVTEEKTPVTESAAPRRALPY